MRSPDRKLVLAIVFVAFALGAIAAAQSPKRISNGSGAGVGGHTGPPTTATLQLTVP